MFVGFQIIAVLFAFIMAYLTYIHYKRHEISVRELVFWFMLWAGFIFTTIFPASLNFLVNSFRLKRVLDLVMIIGFFILTALTFRNFVTVDRLEKKVEKFIRAEALREFHQKEGERQS